MSARTPDPLDVIVARVLEGVARHLHDFFHKKVPVDELMSHGAVGAADARRRWDGRGSFERFAAQRIEWAIVRELERRDRQDDRARLRPRACALAAAEDTTERRARHAVPDEGSPFVEPFLEDMAASFTIELSAPEPDAVPDTASDVERDMERMRVVRALSRLPAPAADLLHRRYYEGQTFEEMERDLGVDKSTLFDRLNRAVERLRELLCPPSTAEVVQLDGG